MLFIIRKDERNKSEPPKLVGLVLLEAFYRLSFHPVREITKTVFVIGTSSNIMKVSCGNTLQEKNTIWQFIIIRSSAT